MSIQMPTFYVVAPTAFTTGAPVAPSAPSTYHTITQAINAAQAGDTIEIGPGIFRENITITKSLIIKGAKAGIAAWSGGNKRSTTTYGSAGSNVASDEVSYPTGETIIRAGTFNLISTTGASTNVGVGSAGSFTIDANDVTIDGIIFSQKANGQYTLNGATYNQQSYTTAVNIRGPYATNGDTTLARSNIKILNCVVYNQTVNTSQNNAISIGENANGAAANLTNPIQCTFSNIEIANTYLDLSEAGNGDQTPNTLSNDRGIVFTNQYMVANYNNVDIHDNRIVFGSDVGPNAGIVAINHGSTTPARYPLFTTLKIKNNYISTPNSTGISGLTDLSDAEISSNEFVNCDGGMSVHFRDTASKIHNNTFNGIVNVCVFITDRVFANPGNNDSTSVDISGNVFNNAANNAIASANYDLNMSDLLARNTFVNSMAIMRRRETTRSKYDNTANGTYARTMRYVFPTLALAENGLAGAAVGAAAAASAAGDVFSTHSLLSTAAALGSQLSTVTTTVNSITNTSSDAAKAAASSDVSNFASLAAVITDGTQAASALSSAKAQAAALETAGVTGAVGSSLLAAVKAVNALASNSAQKSAVSSAYAGTAVTVTSSTEKTNLLNSIPASKKPTDTSAIASKTWSVSVPAQPASGALGKIYLPGPDASTEEKAKLFYFPALGVNKEYELLWVGETAAPSGARRTSITYDGTNVLLKEIGVAGSTTLAVGGNMMIYRNGSEYGYPVYVTGSIMPGGDPAVAPCFPAGQRVLTAAGWRAVEELRNGDMVITDQGKEMPAKIYSSTVLTTAASAPITIPAHVFGRNVPSAPVRLSPRHAVRMDMNTWQFPSNLLRMCKEITQDAPGEKITYYHIALPNYLRDNLVLEGGVVAESYGAPFVKANGVDASKVYTFDKALGGFVRMAPAAAAGKSKSA